MLLPTTVDIPAIDDLAILKHIEVRVLSRRYARMIRQYPHPVAHVHFLKQALVGNRNDTMLLRYTRDPKAEIISVDI